MKYNDIEKCYMTLRCSSDFKSSKVDWQEYVDISAYVSMNTNFFSKDSFLDVNRFIKGRNLVFRYFRKYSLSY